MSPPITPLPLDHLPPDLKRYLEVIDLARVRAGIPWRGVNVGNYSWQVWRRYMSAEQRDFIPEEFVRLLIAGFSITTEEQRLLEQWRPGAEEAFATKGSYVPASDDGRGSPGAGTEFPNETPDDRYPVKRRRRLAMLGPVVERISRRPKFVAVVVALIAAIGLVSFVLPRVPNPFDSGDEGTTAGVGAGVSASSSAATTSAGSCYQLTCLGMDPRGRCEKDIRSLADITVEGILIELRYSAACGAVWGKATGVKKDDLVSVSDGHYSQSAKVLWDGDRPSLMIPATLGAQVRACVETGSVKGCTPVFTITS